MLLQNRFCELLRQMAIVPTGSRLLVAVSGGADSVALLLLLHHVAGPMKLALEAAHLDHALRDESRADASFVEELCAQLAVPLTVERRDVAACASRRKGNLEEVARDVRRDFLASVAEARNCPLIALGHHADDQAETFLMRLLRGSGPAGLAGMSVCDPPWVRPLLPFRRAEIIAYLRQRQARWREDESNHDPRFTRNRIRHQLLPQLESFNPQIRGHLTGLCAQLRQDEAFWSGLVTHEFERCSERSNDGLVLNRAQLRALPPALAGRVIRAALHSVRGSLRSLTAAHVAKILDLMTNGPPQGELSLPDVWVARRYEKLLLYRQRPLLTEPFEVMLPGAGAYPLPDGRVLRLTILKEPLGEGAGVAEFALDRLSFPLCLRTCRPGDRFRPAGMSGTKKLQDLLVDRKLTKEQRRAVLLLLQGDEVLWVVGLRKAEGFTPMASEGVLRIVVEACGTATNGL